MSNELQHHGVQGQRWGIRRYQPYPSGTKLKSGKSTKEVGEAKKTKTDSTTNKTSESQSTPKDPSGMSLDELRNEINRIKAETEYRELTTPASKKKISKGHAFVADVFEKSAKNIATQTVTYVMGKTVNTLAGDNIVNPKKGQKDK
jgi:hypothetical protein